MMCLCGACEMGINIFYSHNVLKLLLSRTRFKSENLLLSSPSCGIHVLDLGSIWLGVRRKSLCALFLLSNHLCVCRVKENVGLWLSRLFSISLNTKLGSKLYCLIPNWHLFNLYQLCAVDLQK